MTNEMKHTPAPWHLDEEFLAIHFNAWNGGISLHKDTPNGLANARLIAAAPDLLAALEYMLREQEKEGFGDEMPDILQARAAIAKATGGQT